MRRCRNALRICNRAAAALACIFRFSFCGFLRLVLYFCGIQRILFLGGKIPAGFSEEDFLKNLDFCVGIVYAYIQLCGFTKKCMTGSEELVSVAAYAASNHCREKLLS